jgi:3-deoxy-D-manno-octulosonic-acid transferase
LKLAKVAQDVWAFAGKNIFLMADLMVAMVATVVRLLLKGLKTPAYRQRIGERLGFIKSITGRVIWVHCVSMGEFRAAIVLIDALIKAF